MGKLGVSVEESANTRTAVDFTEINVIGENPISALDNNVLRAVSCPMKTPFFFFFFNSDLSRRKPKLKQSLCLQNGCLEKHFSRASTCSDGLSSPDYGSTLHQNLAGLSRWYWFSWRMQH